MRGCGIVGVPGGEGLPVVVLVDDDPSVLAALRRAFREESFEVVTTNSPETALRRLRARDVSVLAADYQLPEMCGVDLLERARTVSPRTCRILLTAFAGDLAVLEAHRTGLFTLFAKPWQEGELKRRIREHLRNRELEGGVPVRPPAARSR